MNLLLQRAQEMLDQRLDPLADADFCAQLEKTPDLLSEIILLRATALTLEALPSPHSAAQTVNKSSKLRWLRRGAALVVASVGIWWASSYSSPTDSASVDFVVRNQAPSFTPPQVLWLHHQVQTKALNPSPGQPTLAARLSVTN